MENQRLILVMVLVFILFLLWQNWVEFQAVKYGSPPAPAAEMQTGSTTDDASVPVMPDPVTTVQDVPDITSTAGEAPQEPDAGQIVRVTTDLIKAEIHTIGGTLRQVGLRTYPTSVKKPDEPFLLFRDSGQEIFIAQSGLLALDGLPAPNHYAEFTTDQHKYRLADGQDTLEVQLNWSDPAGLKVTKTYVFHRGSFLVTLHHRVENSMATDWRGSLYRQFQRTPPASSGGFFSGGVITYTGVVVSTPEQRYEKISFSDIEKKALSQRVQGGWVAMIQHYFLGAWIPDQHKTNAFYTKVVGGNRYVAGLRSAIQTVAAGATHNFNTQLYVGPKLPRTLAEIAPNLQLTVDYGSLTIISEPLFWLLEKIHAVVGNWGWAIIFLTLLIKLAFYKLSETSYRSMANMRRLAPELARLKDLYGDDKQKMNEMMMGLYKREKVNPLGGCLPILIQIPVFIALYWVLVESVQLRQAPFMLWIQDMSIPDPYYVLPLIMGATMLIQQKLSPAPPDPMQAKIMMALPIVFTFMFLWFPSGLVLYWVVNNILSILQQWVITRRVESGADNGKNSSGKPDIKWGGQAQKMLSLAKKYLPDRMTRERRKK
ncbi:MAG: membrane protein insertase YidC [Candidatus Contendobacter odensis]|uniref:Membrane protein insertase YidC n=1 Tax=Candidatus Contendibacter odensensis TaxID=1400860 RepID=A0A2G6PER5_9GAMM|nr:MAG: membrane protein insertase YidC [Candidatus Contendobacter odensis]